MLHRPQRLALLRAAFEGFAFVVEFFAFSKGDGDFGVVAFVEIEHQGNDGQAVFVDFGVEFVELLLV